MGCRRIPGKVHRGEGKPAGPWTTKGRGTESQFKLGIKTRTKETEKQSTVVEKEKQKLEVIKNQGRDIGTGREESGHFEVMVVVMTVASVGAMGAEAGSRGKTTVFATFLLV